MKGSGEQANLLGHELLRVLLPQGELCRLCFFLKYNTYRAFCNMLAILRLGRLCATACLIRYPSFFEKQKYKIKTVKMVLELFKLAKQSCNI